MDSGNSVGNRMEELADIFGAVNVITPTQHVRMNTNVSALSPEKRIAISMVDMAWHDANFPLPKPGQEGSRKAQLRQSAIDWFRGGPAQFPFWFCCELLSIDFNWFSDGIIRELHLRALQLAVAESKVPVVTRSSPAEPVGDFRVIDRLTLLRTLRKRMAASH